MPEEIARCRYVYSVPVWKLYDDEVIVYANSEEEARQKLAREDYTWGDAGETIEDAKVEFENATLIYSHEIPSEDSKGLPYSTCPCGSMPSLEVKSDGVIMECPNPECKYKPRVSASTLQDTIHKWEKAVQPIHRELDNKSLREWLASMNPDIDPKEFDNIDMEFFEKLIRGELK